jgi:hypothetical protein
MLRGVIGGLAGFMLAVFVLAAVLGRVLPDDWAPDVFAAAGIGAAVVAGAAGGLAGARAGAPGGGILGALLGAALLVSLQPQADLVTGLSVLAVLAGAAVSSLARRPRGSRRGSARSPLRA